MNQSGDFPEEIEEEILQLLTIDSKKDYLEKILLNDQAVRDSDRASELVSKYGKDSEEYIDYLKTQWKQDEINLIKVEKYLNIHGYPDKEMGQKATTAPLIVIHHAQGYDARERNFEKTYEAYLKGSVDDVAFSLYLERMYEMKRGWRLKIESSVKIKDEIDILIKELDLEEIKKVVKQRVSLDAP